MGVREDLAARRAATLARIQNPGSAQTTSTALVPATPAPVPAIPAPNPQPAASPAAPAAPPAPPAPAAPGSPGAAAPDPAVPPLRANLIAPNVAGSAYGPGAAQTGGVSSYQPAAGAPDPRDATYWADVGKMMLEKDVGLSDLGLQETQAIQARQRTLEDLSMGHATDQRDIKRGGAAQGILFGSETGSRLGMAELQFVRNQARSEQDYKNMIDAINLQASALERGFTVDEASALAAAVYRKTQEIREDAANAAQVGAINAGNQGLQDWLNNLIGNPGGSGAPGTETGSAVGSVTPFTSMAELQQYMALPAGEKSKWQEWHGANPSQTYADWIRLNKPSGTQVFAPPPSSTNPNVSTSLPGGQGGVAYIPPAAGGEQIPQGSTGVFANQAEYQQYQAQPQYIKDRWQRYSARYPNRTWAGFVQRGYPTLG